MANADWKQKKIELRSARGQLLLLAGTFAGALVLAVAALFVKEVFFRGFVRHRTVVLTEQQKELAEGVVTGRLAGSEIEDMDDLSVRALYGALIDATVNDPEKRLTSALVKFHERKFVSRLRITLAAGSREQRFRAIQLLVDQDLVGDKVIMELCREAGLRARRHGDEVLRELAESVVAFGESHPRKPVDEEPEFEKGESDER